MSHKGGCPYGASDLHHWEDKKHLASATNGM